MRWATQITSQPDGRIWAIAGPAIVSNVTTASIGLVDSWAVGHLPEEAALAGLALGAYGMSMLAWALSFLRMGTTGLVAQAAGAGQARRAAEVVVRATIIGLGLGGLLLLAKGPLIEGALTVLGASGPEEDIAKTYAGIRLWGVPLILAKMAVLGLLIGRQRTDIALFLEAFVNISNAVLTLLFVTILSLGVPGAAWASLIAEVSGGLLSLAILVAALRPGLLGIMLRQRRLWRWQAFAALFRLNGALFIRTLLLIAGFGLFLNVAGDIGTVTLAACHIVLNFYVLQALTLDALAYAAEALVGEAIGRDSREEMRAWVIRTTLWAVALSLLYFGVFGAFGRPLFHLFTDQAAVRAAAEPLYIWIALTPPIAIWCYQLDGIFVGAARAKPMMWTMAAALIGFYALTQWLVPIKGSAGLCAAFLSFFGLRGLGLIAAYLPMEKSLFGPTRRKRHAA
ncbi:MAG: MATE family efflux transporter [Pseudomonadota bacterium]